MASTANIQLSNSIQFNDLLELGRDYCSDHLGRFFQNNYSPPAVTVNKFRIPAKFTKDQSTKKAKDGIAICVMMNNHIVDLKYFNDIFPDWNALSMESILSGIGSAKLELLMDDPILFSTIKSFKKINDEIVIGRCRGLEFTPL